MTYFFETYGCQMNIAESAAVEQLLIARGWTKADDAQFADMVIINTCSVRASAESRIIGRLGYFTGLKAVREKRPYAKTRKMEAAAQYVKDGPKPLVLVVMGCMAERLLESLKKDWPAIDYVVGTFAKKNFGDIIAAAQNSLENFSANKNLSQDQNAAANKNLSQNQNAAAQKIPASCAGMTDLNEKPVYKFASLSLEPGAFSSFVPIMNGCNNFCAYCIVPYLRGREVSRPLQEIFAEIKVLSGYGVKEITLLGQNVNSYLCDDPDFGRVDFPRLLELLCRKIEEIGSPIKWIRFDSSHPKDLSDQLIAVMAREEKICKHIHLPVQHGSSRVLQKMNRRYTREHYLELVQKLRAAMPDICLTTDIMIGFPGETQEDFEQVLSLMTEVGYEDAFMYYYNPREGTPAATWSDQISLETKKERLQKIIDLQLTITQAQMEKQVGKTITVLADKTTLENPNELLGKTERDERVAFAADKSLIGSFVQVRLVSLNGHTFKGELV
ncbi:MAG: tRNA (N6-isopentenyl adenosine(37)-C2)-methylthiotransferase MiaB [Treponema sp.]|nr:tRNA (N6-isopentenyl adenosine(37)-C2)-methylthiotransferase MiaB [Treponema sp.]